MATPRGKLAFDAPGPRSPVRSCQGQPLGGGGESFPKGPGLASPRVGTAAALTPSGCWLGRPQASPRLGNGSWPDRAASPRRRSLPGLGPHPRRAPCGGASVPEGHPTSELTGGSDASAVRLRYHTPWPAPLPPPTPRGCGPGSRPLTVVLGAQGQAVGWDSDFGPAAAVPGWGPWRQVAGQSPNAPADKLPVEGRKGFQRAGGEGCGCGHTREADNGRLLHGVLWTVPSPPSGLVLVPWQGDHTGPAPRDGAGPGQNQRDLLHPRERQVSTRPRSVWGT